MDGYWAIKRECDKLNQQGRKVNEVNSIQAAAFWNNAVGNWMITGGTAEQRQEQLVCRTMTLRQHSRLPIIVLNGSEQAEQRMIQAARNGEIGQLQVYSQKYPNYEVLYHTEEGLISNLFAELARQKQYSNIAGIQLYADAFLQIVGSAYPVSLATILGMLEMDDPALISFGEDHGVAAYYLQNVNAYTVEGQLFRKIADDLHRAMAGITVQNCDTHSNCVDLILRGQPITAMIQLCSRQLEDWFACIAAELHTALGTGHPFHLVLNEVPAFENKSMQDVMQNMMNDSRTTVGLCTQNAVTWTGKQESVLDAMQSEVILNDRTWNSSSLGKLLKRYEGYEHHEPVKATGIPPKLFPILKDKHWTVGQMNRDRVRIQDMEQFEALFHGYQRAQLTLARHITYPRGRMALPLGTMPPLQLR